MHILRHIWARSVRPRRLPTHRTREKASSMHEMRASRRTRGPTCFSQRRESQSASAMLQNFHNRPNVSFFRFHFAQLCDTKPEKSKSVNNSYIFTNARRVRITSFFFCCGEWSLCLIKRKSFYWITTHKKIINYFILFYVMYAT